MSWSTLQLQEMTEPERSITYGVVKPGQEDSENGVRFVRGGDIRAGKINIHELRTITQETSKPYSRTILRGGELLVSLVGNPGEVAIVPSELSGANIARQAGLVALRPEFNSRFIMYFLRSPKGRAELFQRTKGAVQQVINLADLKTVNIPQPDLPTQDRIAATLSAYDDLIENNRRRIALLEQAARLLYREWFVHFRFPGHETANFVDGLPKGWVKRSLIDLTTKLGSGATPRGGAGAYQDQGLTLIRSLNVYDYSFHDDGLVFLDDDQAKKLANVTVEKRDVLLNITGASVARCCMVPSRHLPARVNQHVMIVRTDLEECSPFFILHSINAQQNKEKLLSIARAGGATREALTKDVVGNFKILCPSSNLVSLFDEQAERMYQQSELLAASNAQLTKARDLLLPRLMDGRIPVKV